MSQEDKLFDAIMTAAKLLSVEKRRDLIYKLLNANVEEKIESPLMQLPPNSWVI